MLMYRPSLNKISLQLVANLRFQVFGAIILLEAVFLVMAANVQSS